jgi:hypothetical protein
VLAQRLVLRCAKMAWCTVLCGVVFMRVGLTLVVQRWQTHGITCQKRGQDCAAFKLVSTKARGMTLVRAILSKCSNIDAKARCTQ